MMVLRQPPATLAFPLGSAADLQFARQLVPFEDGVL